MFPETDTATIEHPLAGLIDRETGGGQRIVRFLVSMMEGEVDDARPYLRLRAARELAKRIGDQDASDFIESCERRVVQRADRPSPAPDAPPTETARERDAGPGLSLPELVRQETGDGRNAVRFLVDVMEGRLEGYKPHHRLRAAEELLHHGFDVPFLARVVTARLADPTAQPRPSYRPGSRAPNGALSSDASAREARSSAPGPQSETHDPTGAPSPRVDCHCPDGSVCEVIGFDSDEVEEFRESWDADPDQPLCCCLHWEDGGPCVYSGRSPP